MWFKKKGKEDKKDKEDNKLGKPMRSTDSSYTRAKTIWEGLGFVNDRLGSVDRLSGYLEMYKALDEGQLPPERPELYSFIKLEKE